MSDDLQAFYLTYLVWFMAGAEENNPFVRSSGLCHNIEVFCVYVKGISDPTYKNRLKAELRRQLADAGLDDCYPFEDAMDYQEGSNNKELHNNPTRIAWVLNQVKEIKDQS